MGTILRSSLKGAAASKPRRRISILALSLPLALVSAILGPPAASAGTPPSPEPNFAAPIAPAKPCSYDVKDRYEKRVYKIEGWKAPDYERYPGACERLRFAYGPITVKPGQNDVLVEPVTIQSPRRNGYLTRFKPDLVLPDGTIPPVEEVHLHHGTWLAEPSYGGSTAFLASGEEKTIGSWPTGYGMPVKATDQWELLYMIHSAVPQTMQAYITYEIDFVPESKADDHDLYPAYPVWLDVRPSGYPVFNVQRRFGGPNGTCTWPKEQCAEFDPWGEQFVGQGEPGNGEGTSLELPQEGEPMGRVPSFTGGTLVGIAGHVHPGGLSTEVDLVRNDASRRIFTSEAVYWDREDPRKPGGPPTSWDLSMTGTGLPYWGVHVEPGDELRINATYDTTEQATYEDMGIAVAAIAPDGPDGEPVAPGVNPFEASRDRSRDCRSVAGRLSAPIREFRDRGIRGASPELCDRGIVTHGHQEANGQYGGPSGKWTAKPGSRTNRVAIANFQYLPGDLSTVNQSGVPTVKLGERLRFTNLEGSSIYHSVTTCRFPCLGRTGAAFPLADGQTSAGRKLDLDSGELGFGTPYIGPAKQTLDWEVPVTEEEGFKPGETVTYFCRIHPSMRGAFQVTE